MYTSTPYHRGSSAQNEEEEEDDQVEEMEVGTGRVPPWTQTQERARQSYAYPLQQVFEETRSKLMSDEPEPSLFETTLGRARVSLPAGGIDDFIGAMDNLHERFGVVIGCMTDRSQIFEVITAWMQDIDFAVQHQRTNETDLSEVNCRKLQKLLRLECETWNLISLLYYQRLNEEVRPEPYNQPIRDIFCVNEEPYVQAIVESNSELKEMFYIQSWLETNFEKYGPPDLSEKFFIWENTLDAVRRDRLTNKPSIRSMVSSVDPDAPAREGKQLHPLDLEETTKVLKGAFYYIRIGNIDNAQAYLVKSGERIKASAISGYQFTAQTQRDPETGEEMPAQQHAVLPSKEYLPKSKRLAKPNPDFAIRGNPKRDLWKLITWKVCEKNNMNKYDRALLGSVCGHRQAMLDVANTWEDSLWAFLKAAIDVSIEGKLRKLSNPNNRMALPDAYWSQQMSIAECIAKMEAYGKSATTFPEAAFQSLQKYVMMDKVGGFIRELNETLHDILETYDHPILNGHLVRFFTHLFLFLGIVDLPYSQEQMDLCVEKYISILVDINLITKIPYYVQKLTETKQIPIIVHHISPQQRLTRDEILEFLKGCQANDLDVLGIGIAVVDKMRDQEDDFTVENLDWISCCYGITDNSSQVMYEFLKYTIWITRKYLTLGKIDKVKKLIGQISPETVTDVLQISESLENTLVREYVCYKVYLEAEEALSLWTKALSQKPNTNIEELPHAATKADRTVYEKRKKEIEAVETKWRRAVDFHLTSAIEKFSNILKFPMGWLRDCYNPLDEDEALHVNAVRHMIIKKVTHILLRLVQDKNDNRTTRDFLYVLCDDKRNVLCELSPSDIGNILTVIEKFTRQKVSNIMFLPK